MMRMVGGNKARLISELVIIMLILMVYSFQTYLLQFV